MTPFASGSEAVSAIIVIGEPTPLSLKSARRTPSVVDAPNMPNR